VSERQSRTLFVLEEDPPSDRTRWYCHLNGDDAPGFESVEDAVSWGLERATGVVIRTVRTVFYLAGEAPDDWDPGTEYRPWPPTSEERAQIDADYEAATASGAAEEAAWGAYQAERDAWLARSGLPTEGQPVHEFSISVPGTDEVIWFEEFDTTSANCGAATRDGRRNFGPIREVLSALSEKPIDDPWLQRVVTAVERERSWNNGRRSSLDVYEASGEMFHVSATANRASITEHGLDWRRMVNPGVAGATEPELDGIFLCESEFDVEFFTDMSRVPSDVWAVNVSGRWVESGPSGWVFVTEPIPASALRLVRCDVVSSRR
jgi:hypothetical protein